MSTCERCGVAKPEWVDLWAACGDGPVRRDGLDAPETRDTYKLVIACRERELALLRQKLAASETNSQGFAKLAFEEGRKSFALEQKLSTAESKLVEAERELSDVRALDALACRYGTRLDIPSEIPGFDPGDGSDHLHFVLMPIGARSRRAAVEYLATTLLDKEGG